MPALRQGFRIVGEWERIAFATTGSVVHSPGIGALEGWLLWIQPMREHGYWRTMPIHTFEDALQGEVDKLAFIACRRADQAFGLTIPK